MIGEAAHKLNHLESLSTAPRLRDRFRRILASRNLSVYALATLSRERHPRDSSYHLPHNLLFRLENERWTPTIEQLTSLAELSGYRLMDWFRIFGLDPDDISSTQAGLTRPRTTPIDAKIKTRGKNVRYLKDRGLTGAVPEITPVVRYVETAGPFFADSLPFPKIDSHFSYAKIGLQDAFAFPDVLPGSIVRANSKLTQHSLITQRGRASNTLFLIQHGSGMCCSRLHVAAENRVSLIPTQLPFASVELELGQNARILGVIDLELRPLCRPKTLPTCSSPEVTPALARIWTPARLIQESTSLPSPRLLRQARLNAGFSLRNASSLSREIAKRLNDDRYFVSQGSLSDYEVSDHPPRHIHKLFSLCILYAVPHDDLLRSYGIDPGVGQDPMPSEWFADRQGSQTAKGEPPVLRGFLAERVSQLVEIPVFASAAVRSLSGLPELSLRDLFWVDTTLPPVHPSVAGAFLIAVNRRKNMPPAYLRKAVLDRPLFLMMRRDGRYLLGACTLENNILVAHAHTTEFAPPERFRNRVDVEVVGQITAALRSLGETE
jgi:transcriptional regulator with XRE-family HTH domain